MAERNPVSWTPLTVDQRKSVPNADHSALFTRDEVLAALQKLVPAEEAAAIADELYAPDREPDVFFFGELLTALSGLSDSAAERVRTITAPPEEGLPPRKRQDPNGAESQSNGGEVPSGQQGQPG